MTKRQVFQKALRGEILTPAVIAALCLLAAAFGDAGRQALRYERAALAAGQWWRIVTAHLVHLSAAHTILNLAALGLLVLLFGRDLSFRAWVGAGLAAACGIAAGLFLFSPDVGWYVGLSGVLHGWFAFAAARLWRHERIFASLLLAALAAKLVYEQLAGALPSTLALEVGPVVVAAHLYGALAGAAWFGLLAGLERVGMPGRRPQG